MPQADTQQPESGDPAFHAFADRYHRQAALQEIGPAGQERLGRAHAVVVGCGALGCVAVDLLARAGVGRITVIDRDLVEPTNLQRQTLFTEADAAQRSAKAEAAAARLAQVNSQITVRPVVADLTHRNAESLVMRGDLGPPSVIVDGLDNFDTRYLLNDLAVAHETPIVFGGAVGTVGSVFAVEHAARRGAGGRSSPCLRCICPEPPGDVQPTCDTVGVFGPLISLVAGMQAAIALKILTQDPASSSGEAIGQPALHQIDAWALRWRAVGAEAAPDPACPCCARRDFEFLRGDRGAATVALCGRDAVQFSPPPDAARPDLREIAARLAPSAATRLTRFFLRADFPAAPAAPERPVSMTIFADGRVLVEHAADVAHARAVLARYLGR